MRDHRMNATTAYNKLVEAGIPFEEHDVFVNQFWGTRFIFSNYKTAKRAATVLEDKIGPKAYNKKWCIEYYC